MSAREVEPSERESGALAALAEARAEVARRRQVLDRAVAADVRGGRHAESLSKAIAAKRRELATAEAASTDERVRVAAEGGDFSAGVSDDLIELRDDLAIDEGLAEDFVPVRTRLKEQRVEAERDFYEAEHAVRRSAVAVVGARVDDDLDALDAARAEVERREQRVEAVLRLTAGPFHRHQTAFKDVPSRLRDYVRWQDRTYAPRTDPLQRAEDRVREEFAALLDGISVTEEH